MCLTYKFSHLFYTFDKKYDMQIVFATNNSHKVEEAVRILGPDFEIMTPASLGFDGDIPETHPTIRENSIQKAMFIWDRFHKTCFADDTGLEVDVLDGAPGVYSARYAGEGKNPADNRRKLLKELEGVPFEKRTARFRCVVTIVEEGVPTVFEGVCQGHIALQESTGVQGFGYDVLFVADGFDRTMAEISIDEKNSISHRGKAMELLQCHLSRNPR